MTPEELALRWSVCLDPGDDAPRLIFADWLEESGRGDAAAFLRRVVRFDHRLEYPAELAEAYEVNRYGCRELLSVFDPDQYSESSSFVIRRGFAEEWTCTTQDYELNAFRVFSRHPITWVKFTDLPGGGADRRELGRFIYRSDRRDEQTDEDGPYAISFYAIPDGVRIALWANDYPLLIPDSGPTHLRWLNQEAAFEAISKAAVSYGRQEAGLPPWPTPEPEGLP